MPQVFCFGQGPTTKRCRSSGKEPLQGSDIFPANPGVVLPLVEQPLAEVRNPFGILVLTGTMKPDTTHDGTK